VSAPDRYEVDPSDPRAPDLETWEQLSPAERRRILDALPSELDLEPPEGDSHRLPKQKGLDALDAYYRSSKRQSERRAEHEARRAEKAEARIAELEAELARLKKERP
jgi:hypothetical protein